MAAVPIPDRQRQFVALYDGSRDWLAGRSIDEKLKVLKITSYRDYLIRHCGCGDEVANCFQGRTLDFFGLGCDAVAAADVRDFGYPGFDGLGLPVIANPERSEPYIYHFPDGNASLARLLVRSLLPEVAPGNTMDDIVLAPFDYDALDRIGQNTRIRLNATCVNVRDAGDEVLVGYVRDGTPHRVAAKHVGARMLPHDHPVPHAAAAAGAARGAGAGRSSAACLYQRTGTRLAGLGAAARLPISWPRCRFTIAWLSIFRSASAAIEIREILPSRWCFTWCMCRGTQRWSRRTCQFRAGRAKLLDMTFADFEVKIRDELDRMLGQGGFSSARDILAITVNRWSHGYGYVANSLFDGDDYEQTLRRARQPAGRVAIANSDAGGDAYAHLAIDHAERAVHELLKR